MIDPRGPRFGAWITTIVLALVLLTGSAALLAAQALVFALGSQGKSPYAVIFKRLIRPRLSPPVELEDERPPRFAQVVGLLFALTGVIALWAGAPTVGLLATGAAFIAALLNAAFGICLGCEMFLLYKRLTTKGVLS